MTWKSASVQRALVFSATLLLGAALFNPFSVAATAPPPAAPSPVSKPPSGPPSPPAPPEVYLEQVIGPIGSGRDVLLQGTTVTGPVMTGRSIRGTACVTADLIAAIRVELDSCRSGNVVAGQMAALRHTRVNGNVQAVKYLSLLDSQVAGDAQTSGSANIQRSTIGGALTVFSNSLTLLSASVGDVRLGKSAFAQGPVSVSGASITRLENGKTLMRVSEERGQAIYKGFKLEGVDQSTILTVPQGARFRNGLCQALCNGLTSYTSYMARYKDAPLVEGPGWPRAAVSGSVWVPASSGPTAYLELDQGSVVRGDVIFIGDAPGRVALKNGSRVQGVIRGGILESAP